MAKDCQPTLWWSEENGRGRDCVGSVTEWNWGRVSRTLRVVEV